MIRNRFGMLKLVLNRRKSFIIALLGFFVSLSQAGEKPVVASMTLCADRLLLALADPAQIASLSHLALDPDSMIQRVPDNVSLNHGQLEEMLTLDVDYIFASEFDHPRTIDRLRQFGMRVELLASVRTLMDAIKTINHVAALLQQPERGNQLAHQLSTITHRAHHRQDKRAIILGANHYISGENTLFSDLIERLGFQNIAAQANISTYRQVSIEQIIAMQPDVIILNRYSRGYSRAQAVLDHAVFKYLSRQVKIYSVPTRESICGDAGLMMAARRLM